MAKTIKRRVRYGRIRVSDDADAAEGVSAGDIAHVDLTKQPKDGDLCAAFTAYGHLVIRRFRRVGDDVELTTGREGDPIKLFAPGAVIIFGRVARVEKGGAA